VISRAQRLFNGDVCISQGERALAAG
jgi:hypothetical protein